MSRNLLLKYFEIQEGEFEKNFPIVKTKQEETANHDLRVSLKKLKCYFNLIEFINPEKINSRKQFSELLKLFKKIGLIRDVQVQQQVVGLYKDEQDVNYRLFSESLEKSEKKRKKAFCEWMEKYKNRGLKKQSKKIRKICKKFSDAEIRDKVFDFLEQSMESICRSSGLCSEKEIHRLRRKLKEAFYTLEILSLFQPGIVMIETLMISIRDLEKMLGEWHDRIITLEALQNFCSKTPECKKCDSFKAMRKQMLSDNRKIIRNVKNRVPTLFR